MITFAILVLSSRSTEPFTVVEAHRTEVFAGKLGKRVEDSYVVERDGSRMTIHIGHRHTRMGVTAPFSVGQLLSLPGDVSERHSNLLWDEVRVAK